MKVDLLLELRELVGEDAAIEPYMLSLDLRVKDIPQLCCLPSFTLRD